ncbi:hypothetical protein IT575_03435 [bacterium]|nr:hypothetical protein [bacterium]
MSETGPPLAPLAGIGWALTGYLVLQLLLNIINVRYVRGAEARRRPLALIICAFWSGVANALYFVGAAVLLRVLGLVDNTPPAPGLPGRMLLGLVLGPVLWYWLVLARGLGRRLFGVGELVAADEAILRAPPSLSYVSWGLINLSLIQPLGRELFVRGVFLATLQRVLAAQVDSGALLSGPALWGMQSLGPGWVLAILLMLVVDVLLRVNIVWLPATLAYGLGMAALFYFTGDATAGLTAASVAGFIQGVTLLRLTLRKYKQMEEQREQELLSRGSGTA